jgi:hypothetical protein
MEHARCEKPLCGQFEAMKPGVRSARRSCVCRRVQQVNAVLLALLCRFSGSSIPAASSESAIQASSAIAEEPIFDGSHWRTSTQSGVSSA